jgi:hypothetical protein
LDVFKATNLVPQGNCVPLDLSGRGLETGDLLANVVGGATAQAAVISLGDLRAETTPVSYTVVGEGVVEPIVERVVLLLDGIVVGDDEVSTSGASPTASWSIDTAVAAGAHLLRANWVEADGTSIAFVERTIQVLDECQSSSEGGEHGGGSGLCSNNLAPSIVADSFELLGSDLVELGSGSASRSFQVRVRDMNGADTLEDPVTVFTPSTGITLVGEPSLASVGDSLTDLLVTVHFTVANDAPLGLVDIGFTAFDDDGLSAAQTFQDVFEVIAEGDYLVRIAGGDVLQFGAVQSDTQNVATTNYFTVTNLLHEANAFEFSMEDFQNFDSTTDCTADDLTDLQSLDCIELIDNLQLVVDPSKSGGAYTFAGPDVVTLDYDGAVVSLGEIADGAEIAVKLVILDVGILHQGHFGSTFEVPEPTPVAAP